MEWNDLKIILDQKLLQLIANEGERVSKDGPDSMVIVNAWEEADIPDLTARADEISKILYDYEFDFSVDEKPHLRKGLTRHGDNLVDEYQIEKLSPPLYMKFCEAANRMMAGYYKQALLVHKNIHSFENQNPVNGSTDNLKQLNSKKISEAVESFCLEKKKGNVWGDKTEQENRYAFRLLIAIVGDNPIESVKFPEAEHFKSTLCKLPSLMTKKKLYKNKSIDELLELTIKNTDLLSVSKINAFMQRVSALFSWSIKQGYTQLNPFSGIGIKQNISESDKRLPFDDSDLKKLFSSEIYQEGKIKKPYHYWLPLMGLYTGARIEELSQLYLVDIYKNVGTWVIDINSDGDKTTKNLSSVRRVPIHSRLIELGLIDFVEDMNNKKQTRLFPELKRIGKKYSPYAVKWFGAYKRKQGITDKRKTFHSFRHTVANELKQMKTPLEHIQPILGHKDATMTTGTYGSAYEPSTLAPVVEQLNFSIEIKPY